MSYCRIPETALRAAAALAVERAVAAGASAAATASASGGARIVVRDGEVETAVRDGQQSIAVTLFRDGRSSSARSASLDPQAIVRLVDEALAIAAEVEPDTVAGLADPAWLAAADAPDPALYHASARDPAVLVDEAMAIDVAARAAGCRVDQAGAMAGDGLWALATSDGFDRASRYSMHGRWCAVLADDGAGAVSDSHQSQDRRADRLEPVERVAVQAATRALTRRGARGLASGRVPVLFEPRAAMALIGDLVAALSGAAQHRGASFLPDPLGRAVAAPHLDLVEDPFEPFGLASGGFDAEGVAGSRRAILEGGVARGLFLDSRFARLLQRRSTGNAGGPYNLALTSRSGGGDRAAMLARLGSGLLVTQLLGGATDPVRGTWTRAVAGHWVEQGVIAHAVRDVTLAGELPTMLNQISAIGDETERHGAFRTGPILVEAMQLGGSA